MLGEQRTRTLLGLADPARDVAVAPPRLSAHDLIVRAEAAGEPVVGRRRARPTRRLVLAAGVAAVAAGATAVSHPFGTSTVDSPKVVGPPGVAPGPVLVPIAYQFDTGAPAAGAHLRALAGRLVDAPYESRTGRYAYHHTKVWGDPILTSADGRYHVAFVSETKIWQAADGTGKQVSTQLDPQFPDQPSRDYWARNLQVPSPKPDTLLLRPEKLAPLPSDRAQLTELLKVTLGAGTVSKEVRLVYGRYAVPRQTRAEILRILADVPGFLWRGEVTDRAGRKGVAITVDDREHDQQRLLIFNPSTGELLGHELLTLSPTQTRFYGVILATDRTDQVG